MSLSGNPLNNFPIKSEEDYIRDFKIKESKPKTICNKKQKIALLAVIISFIVIGIITLIYILIILDKKTEKISKGNYIISTYNSKEGIPLKLFNPSRIGLNDQNITIEEISANNKRTLQQINITDGVIIPETTGTIQIKISFSEPLTTLDFMFEGCSDLVKIILSYLNSTSITSMIYTFTDCTNLETVDFTSFSSSNIEKMEFLFAGCSNLVNIKGFENLDTSSLQKTAGMFIECKNLISVNLSSFQFNNISEQNGMFIENPSLEKLDLGNTTDINGLFSSTENFKVTIITSSSELNSSGLNGEFTRISREENQILNCTLRNWTEFLLKYDDDYEKIVEYYSDIVYQIKKYKDNYILGQNFYDRIIDKKNIDCNSQNNSFYSLNSGNNYNYSECERYKRFYIDFLNEFEKCNECDNEEGRRMYCKSCIPGYYVPKGIDFTPIKCKKCDEGCTECVSDNETDKSVCIKCEGNDDYEDENKFKLYNGKCIKKCEISNDGERCRSCKEEDGKYDECLTCNDGYYFDINYNKSKCKRIDIENCTQAIIESDSVRCINCTDGYIIHNDQCEKSCDFGYWKESCASCNQTYEFRENCASCHSGFYLFPSGNKTICKYCNSDSSSSNCKECEYFSGEVKCTECNSDSFLADGKCIQSCSGGCSNCIYENGKWLCNKCKENYFLQEIGEGKSCEKCQDGCQSCISANNCSKCIEGYKLINGKCEYYCTVGSYYQCKTCDFNERNKCKDCNPGYYLPNNQSNCYYCESHCISCYGDIYNPICTLCDYGYSLSNNKCIKKCNLGNYNYYCKTCDILIPENCGSCHDGYYLSINYKRYCYYCGSYRIKRCHQDSNYNIIIDECYPDYILIRNSCVEKCDSNNYWSRCLVCNEEHDKLDQCKQCKEGYYLPTDMENSYCYYCPNNCKSCEGTSYNTICKECYNGYILSGGKCLKECYIGNNRSCKSCNPNPGKINRCLDCNEGYYLPDNNNQEYCLKCPNNCQKCNSIDGYENCTECSSGYHLVQTEVNQYDYYYNPVYYHICKKCEIPGCKNYKPNSNICICAECNTPVEKQNKADNEIISCYDGCEIGELDKCKSCGLKEGECGDCNNGYTLNRNGKCVADFHMFAKYRTTSENEKVELMYNSHIIKMIINGTIINKPTNYYTFPLPGEHLIYVKFSRSISFMDLFFKITHVTYIEFLPKANELNINYMNDCFCGCINLEYVDLSNLNLKNNRCFMNFFKDDKKLKEVKFPDESFNNIYWYYRMFYGCESLTSIDMSNIHNTNGQYFYEMFYGCTNLKSINLGGFNKRYYGYESYDLFIKVPKDAEITIHNNFYQSIEEQLNNFPNKKIIN